MPSIEVLNSVSVHISIYVDLLILFNRLIGNIFNLLIFLSLKTFRENSSSFYLTAMSFLSIDELLTDSSLTYCKFRAYFFQICSLASFTVAHHAFVISFFIRIIHGIPTLIYQTRTISTTTEVAKCEILNSVFQKYYNYGFIIILASSLPVVLTTLFGSLAYHSIRQLAFLTVPLVRRELDKQLASMVLVQAVFNFYVIVPYIVRYVVNFSTNMSRDSYNYVILQFAINLTLNLLYLCFAVNPILYLYMCIGKIP
ncbi:unnamed protein product [Rotaria magnacalcarata]|uniref:G-protein coupled receptors family 1 profile domain-containing protein n=1 Tax=Rotaria magnacalcarata TaxID=392030 RepID=A0A819YAX4_9BILA|nr:unnamed protein product [Rotaria magnacalcarata]